MRMKAAFLAGLRRIDISETDAPSIVRDTDVLIRVKAVGVCGSDIHYYNEGRIGDQIVKFPFVVGHEMMGVVEAIGALVSHVRPGDRIVVDPAISCRACAQCRKGRFHTCSSLVFLGCPGQIEGCLSGFVVMPEHCCFPIPDSMSDDAGVLCEPLSIGIYAWRLSQADASSYVGVLGTGPIGLAVLAAARANGAARVYTTDLLDYRCDTARRLGAAGAFNPGASNAVEEIRTAEPDGLDVVFECSGTQEAFDQGMRLLAPGGKLVIVGIPRGDRISFHAHAARRLELSFINVRRQNECVLPAIELLAQRDFSYGKIVTHHFPLDETARAFDLVSRYDDGVVKAVIVP